VLASSLQRPMSGPPPRPPPGGTVVPQPRPGGAQPRPAASQPRPPPPQAGTAPMLHPRPVPPQGLPLANSGMGAPFALASAMYQGGPSQGGFQPLQPPSRQPGPPAYFPQHQPPYPHFPQQQMYAPPFGQFQVPSYPQF
jgi:twitching motility protein PilT